MIYNGWMEKERKILYSPQVAEEKRSGPAAFLLFARQAPHLTHQTSRLFKDLFVALLPSFVFGLFTVQSYSVRLTS